MDLAVFLFSAAVIGVAGTKLSQVADRLADRTGWGEALIGAVLLGASTSISGSVLSAISAYDGLTELAISNAIGGIAVQTFFLVLVDIGYRKANLEHAAVSSTNIMLSCLLIGMLCLPFLAQGLPNTTVWGVHPLTLVLFLGYAAGLKYAAGEKKNPMWRPKVTEATIEDEPQEPMGGRELSNLFLQFAFLALILVVSGIGVKISGVNLAESWGISHAVLGTLMTAVATSLPELVTTIAAVRRGALTLAVGGIVGGNSFDVLFLAFSDITYRQGSLYHQMTAVQISYIALTVLMTVVLMMGLIRRERSGVGNIGSESFIIGLLYIISVLLVMYS